MPGAEPLGDEDLDGVADELGRRISEQLLNLAVDRHDPAVLSDDDGGVRGGLDEVAEHGFGPFPLTGVAGDLGEPEQGGVVVADRGDDNARPVCVAAGADPPSFGLVATGVGGGA